MAAASPLELSRFPALCSYFRLRQEVQLGPKELEKLKNNKWKNMSISYPDWMAPYFVLNCEKRKRSGLSPYCTFYNHLAGHGCNKEGCTFVHCCMVCQSPEHGTFFPDEANYSKCPVVRQQEAECLALQRHGFAEEDLHIAWLQSDRKLLFESSAGAATYRYERSHLEVSGFPRRADLHVYKASAEVVRQQMTAKGIANGGFISLPTEEEKKNALVFVLYY